MLTITFESIKGDDGIGERKLFEEITKNGNRYQLPYGTDLKAEMTEMGFPIISVSPEEDIIWLYRPNK